MATPTRQRRSPITADTFKALRTQAGYSLDVWAELLAVPAQTVRNWENPGPMRNHPGRSVVRLAQLLTHKSVAKLAKKIIQAEEKKAEKSAEER